MSKAQSIVLLALLLTLARDVCGSTTAFVSTFIHTKQAHVKTPWNLPSPTDDSSASSSSAMGYSNGATIETTEEVSEFQRRLRKITLAPTTSTEPVRHRRRSANVQMVDNLRDYKELVVDKADRLVVVRFYADWCRACRAIEPQFIKLAHLYPEVRFLEVPVTAENSSLHQGLGVPSLPYGHIYHPEAGLVEELRINKKEFGHFTKVLESYVQGSCAVPEESLNELVDA